MKYFLTFLLIPLFLISCGGESDPDELLPDASGQHGSILVIMENNLWDGQMGDALRAQLDQKCEGPYLRPEPLFNYYQTKPGTLTHMNKLNRLILKVFVDHDSTYAETCLHQEVNYYARGQMFLIVKDSDPNRLMSYIQNDFQDALDVLNDFEKDQLMTQFKKRPNKAVKERAEENFGISINIPRDSKLKVEKDTFMWVKYDRSRNMMGNEANNVPNQVYWIQEGIVFWSEPYSDSAMDPYHILEKRDSVLKYNIPGKVRNSYMATEYDPCCAPEGTVTTFKGNECVIFRGLWIHAGRRGAAGGGPFVQYTVRHPSNNQVITVCGYVYAPRFDKREYIRELEAMLSSIEFQS